MWLLTAGARQEVWDKFDPAVSPQRSRESGFAGSDQAWISSVLGPGQKTWDKQDGVHSFRAHCLRDGGKLPQGARIVFFHGNVDPWGPEAQELEWVRENWR